MVALRPLPPRTVVERRARSLPCRVLVNRVVPVRQGTRRQPFGRSVLPRQLRFTLGNLLAVRSARVGARTAEMRDEKGGQQCCHGIGTRFMSQPTAASV